MIIEVHGRDFAECSARAGELIQILKERLKDNGSKTTSEETGYGNPSIRWTGGTQPQLPALLAMRGIPRGRDGDTAGN